MSGKGQSGSSTLGYDAGYHEDAWGNVGERTAADHENLVQPACSFSAEIQTVGGGGLAMNVTKKRAVALCFSVVSRCLAWSEADGVMVEAASTDLPSKGVRRGMQESGYTVSYCTQTSSVVCYNLHPSGGPDGGPLFDCELSTVRG